MTLSPAAAASLPGAPQAGQGSFPVQGCYMVSHTPGFFGTSNQNIESRDGQVNVAQTLDGVNLNATVNDPKGHSFGVDVRINQTGAQQGPDSNVSINGQTYPAKRINSGDQTMYVYGDAEQPNRGSITFSQNGTMHSVDFNPPITTPSSQDPSVTGSVYSVQYRENNP